VAITGASGLVGTALRRHLEAAGHTVRPLVRRDPRDGEIRWDPAGGVLDPADLSGVDAVIHLAGESIASRWDDAKKQRIRDSRVHGTRLIAEAVAAAENGPRTLISASAVGIYGNPSEVVNEHVGPGDGFLAEVGVAWEAAAEPARAAGVRVVHPRIGIVLAPDGGALEPMLPAFRLGLGGPIGAGTQGFAWVHLDDVVRILTFLLDSDLDGPVNTVGPEPLDQRTFATTLGRVLGRPAFVPLPGVAVRLAMGEMGEALLLGGQRVEPTRLRAAGFSWTHPTLEDALRDLLN
jgi:uncharacterized protein (TIGR01777 family)